MGEVGLLFEGYHTEGLGEVVCGFQQPLQVLRDIRIDRADMYTENNRRLIKGSVRFERKAFAKCSHFIERMKAQRYQQCVRAQRMTDACAASQPSLLRGVIGGSGAGQGA